MNEALSLSKNNHLMHIDKLKSLINNYLQSNLN